MQSIYFSSLSNKQSTRKPTKRLQTAQDTIPLRSSTMSRSSACLLHTKRSARSHQTQRTVARTQYKFTLQTSLGLP